MNDYEDDGETPAYGQEMYGVKPAFIVAVDMSQSMFETNNKNSKIYFREVLESLKATYESLYFCYTNFNPISCHLAYSEDEGKEPILIGFDQSIAVAIRKLEEKLALNDVQLIDEFQPKSQEFSFANFVYTWHRAIVEKTKSAKNFERRVLYLTRTQLPYRNVPNVQEEEFRTLNFIKCLKEDYVCFNVLFYKGGNVDLDDKFYTQIETEMQEENCEKFTKLSIEAEEDLFEKLKTGLTVLNKRQTRFYWDKRNPGDYMIVDLVSLSKERKLLRKRAMRQNLSIVHKTINKGLLDGYQQKKYSYYKKNGAVKMDLSEEEMQSIKSNTQEKVSNGLHLVSVTDKQSVPGYSLKKNRLVFLSAKNQDGVAGKYRDIFDAMWDHLHATGRVLNCLIRMQKNQKLTKVELSPLSVNGRRCFVMKVQPSLNNIRHFTPRPIESQHPSSEQKATVRRIVEKLQVDFHPLQLNKIRLNNHRKYVMDKQLKRHFQLPENLVAKTMERIAEQLRSDPGLLSDFQELFPAADEKPKPKAKRQRKA